MKIIEFDYIKKNEEKSHRNGLLLQERDKYIDVLDYGYLEEDEIKEAEAIKKTFEDDMKSFIKKAFRRFSKEGINNLEETKE